MLAAVLGLVATDLALDLGSARTRLGARGHGTLADLATAVAVRHGADGQRAVFAVGDEALACWGRTPADVTLARPVRAGHVADPEAVGALLVHTLRALHGRTPWAAPRVAVAVAPELTPADVAALDAALAPLAARQRLWLSRPLAAAVGAGLDLDSPRAQMVVDLGAGTTDIAVLGGGGLVSHTSVALGGDVLDAAVVRHVERAHALRIGPATAERLKRTLGAASAGHSAGPSATAVVGGRCLRSGLPRAAEVHADALGDALAEPVSGIAAAVRRALEATSAEITADVVHTGVVLTGGGARLRGLDVALRHQTGLAMLDADQDGTAVLRGLLAALTRRELAQRLAVPLPG